MQALALAILLAAQTAQAPDLSYEINATLDPETREIAGDLTMRWRNPGAASVDAVPVHLYLNAFKSHASTWMQERWGSSRIDDVDPEKFSEIYDDPWGWVDMTKVAQVVGPDDERECTHKSIAPDDGNPFDETLAEITLAQAIPPGGVLTLKVEFTSRLPIPLARTGGREDYFHAGQWFPKIGVLDPKHGWMARQFHASTEFFSDIADYTVTIRVPEGFEVVATGERESEETTGGMRVLRYTQPNVIDFAFVTGKQIYVETHEYTPTGGGDPIQISYVTPTYAKDDKVLLRMRQAAETTFDVLGSRIGPYPFSTMKVIQPPWKALASSGMEYPTLVTGLPGDRLFNLPVFENARFLESVIVHEIAHNYFQGIVGSNEQMQAFLDEGFTSYWTLEGMRELRERYGKDDPLWYSLLGSPISELDGERGSLADAADDIDEAMIRQPANLFYPGTGRDQIYAKSALIFTTAANLYGQDNVDKIFRTYYARWAFRHPNADDFLRTVDAVAPPEMAAFVHEAFTNPRVPDYKIEKASSKSWTEPKGKLPESTKTGLDPAALEEDGTVLMVVTDPGTADKVGGVERRSLTPVFEETEGDAENKEAEDAENKEGEGDDEDEDESPKVYTTDIRVRSPRWATLPVEIRFVFEDGAVLTDVWDGRAAWRAYAFVRPAKLREVRIDPDQKIVLDPTPANNSRRIEKDRKIANEASGWFGMVVQWLSVGVSWWL